MQNRKRWSPTSLKGKMEESRLPFNRYLHKYEDNNCINLDGSENLTYSHWKKLKMLKLNFIAPMNLLHLVGSNWKPNINVRYLMRNPVIK